MHLPSLVRKSFFTLLLSLASTAVCFGQVIISESIVQPFRLSVDAGEDITIVSRGDLSFFPAGLTNDGLIFINSTSDNAVLGLSGTQTITGSGEIVLGDFPNNFISGGPPENPLAADGTVVTNGADHTIRGAGVIADGNLGGNEAQISIINDGTILAQGTNPLVLRPILTGFFINNGTLRAEGAGGLIFSGGAYTNNTTIEVLDGSQAVINNFTSILGGTLTTAGTGVVNANSGSDFTAVTLSAGSNLAQADSAFVEIRDGLTNNGAWSVNSITQPTTLAFVGTQSITGTGEIVLSDRTGNFIHGDSSGEVLTNEADHTIRGAGVIGSDSFGVRAVGIVNEGTILAQGDEFLAFNVSSDGFINNGTLRAEGAGGLVFVGGAEGSVFTNNTTIEVLDGSQANVNSGAEIVGGTLTTVGTGVINANNNSDFTGVTLSAGSSVVQGLIQEVEIRDGLTNNGVWSINGTSQITNLTFVGTQSITGTGEIVLADHAGNFINGSSGTVLTNGADHTIRGGGSIAVDLVNEGRIVGGSAAAPITVSGVNRRLAGSGPLENVVIGGFDNTHAPGDTSDGEGVGAVAVSGAYSLSNTATLEIDLAGTTPGTEHDQIDAAGDVTLDGTLSVELIDGFVPEVGDTFTVVTSDNPLGGAFDTIELPLTAPNFTLAWDVQITANDITLEAVSVTLFAGDYNGDGAVDVADFTVWRDSLGATGLENFAGADGNGDGQITIADYTVWVDNFGLTSAAAFGSAAPEPNTVMLLGIGLLGVVVRRR